MLSGIDKASQNRSRCCNVANVFLDCFQFLNPWSWKLSPISLFSLMEKVEKTARRSRRRSRRRRRRSDFTHLVMFVLQQPFASHFSKDLTFAASRMQRPRSWQFDLRPCPQWGSAWQQCWRPETRDADFFWMPWVMKRWKTVPVQDIRQEVTRSWNELGDVTLGVVTLSDVR